MSLEIGFDIYPQFEAFYIESMLWHTNSVLDAVKIVDDWIELIEKDNEKALKFHKAKLFEQLQLIIQHSAAISKYLWPIRNGESSLHKRRGSKIRSALQVQENSALKCRKLRDGIEHFDEKLDKYLIENQVGEFLSYDVRLYVPESKVPLHIFKGFYISSRVFVLLGMEYELLPIIAEVKRIHYLLMACVNSGYRFSHE